MAARNGTRMAARIDPPDEASSPRLTTRSQGREASSLPCIGAHCSGGLRGAAEHARRIGAEAVQIFIGSPRTWKAAEPKEQDRQRFRDAVREETLGPVFVHGSYLVNLAAQDAGNLRRSIANLAAQLREADRAGAEGLIFHPGSAGKGTEAVAMRKLVRSIEQVLDEYEGRCKLTLEVCAGQGRTMGQTFAELGEVLRRLDEDPRLAVCWDTCHLFNAGYDVSTEAGLARTMEEFEEEVGFEWLQAVHANDSKTPLGARRDRHENIGEGCIGEEAFGRMLAEPRLRRVPWILEVPGFQKKGPDKRNVEILKRLAGRH